MSIKNFKPTTPARRSASVEVLDKALIAVKEPVRSLISIKKKRSGRNASGKITVRHRGGGTRRYYRMIDIPAKVESLQYDPNRSSYIALLIYQDGERRYIIAPESIKVNDVIMSSKNKIAIKEGNRMPLEHIPWGHLVHDVELVPGKGGQVAKAAGASLKLMGIEGNFAQLKMPSSEVRLVSKDCMATIGQVSNPEHNLVQIGKAGRTRNMGIKPTVRGKVMNPVDHPHGGGEGKHPIGMKFPKTPWGKVAIGGKTRKRKKYSNRLILQRRKQGKHN